MSCDEVVKTLPTYKLATWNISQSRGFAQFLLQQDIVILQEANPLSRKEITEVGFQFVSKAPSHCGETHIYVKNGITASAYGDSWPHGTTCAVINDKFYVCGVHWPPFKDSARKRATCARLIADRLQDRPHAIIVGDTNMRNTEVVPEFKDTFNIVGDPKDHRWTMNGYENAGWWADRPFKWTCRYDRVYLRMNEWTVKRFCVDKGNFISDHYCVKVELKMQE